MADELDVHYTTVRDWVRQYKRDGANAFPGSGNLKLEDDELRRLRRELADLKEENEILKKRRPTSRKNCCHSEQLRINRWTAYTCGATHCRVKDLNFLHNNPSPQLVI
jgi:transposase-like protein